MEAVRTSETSVDNHFTRQYIPEDNSEHHTHRHENLKSQIKYINWTFIWRSVEHLETGLKTAHEELHVFLKLLKCYSARVQ
jgi:hypothetical protein